MSPSSSHRSCLSETLLLYLLQLYSEQYDRLCRVVNVCMLMVVFLTSIQYTGLMVCFFTSFKLLFLRNFCPAVYIILSITLDLGVLFIAKFFVLE